MSTPRAERFVCIHGHFYQPPRENPWLEAVEVQDSAAPYHDWNERITVECYAPNAVARLLDEVGSITALRNNYNSMSFNFGPTLLSWMERARPDVYAQIVLADQDSARRLGRGNALAQVYGHCIMPLASQRDQQTQVRWGIADFVHRFGRQPDGMWLPETAVDRATLAVLAENGIRFTILAPSQARRVRYGDGAWHDVDAAGIDCTRPYRCTVGPGLTITLFFYDAGLSHAIAFGGLLNDGRELARRVAAAGDGRATSLAHIATDGESYGHHHRFGDMALAAALEALQHDPQVELTNYAAYLDHVPVHDEVEIRDNTSWSCAHGIERWRAHCGCNSGGHPDWQQTWRAPLRQSLDWLKTQLDKRFEQHAAAFLRDPWAARDAYVAVLVQPAGAQRAAFLAQHAAAPLQERELTRVWKLLEMQRYALLSFTSCGWFFDEPSGIETVQILTYAARAIQLAAEFGVPLESEFLRRLQAMRSNLPAHPDGRQVYRQLVRPQLVDGRRLIAHYAMHSLFAPVEPDTKMYAYRITALDRTAEHAGTASLLVGRARVRTDATQESADYWYAALHLGGHDMHCAVADGAATPDYAQIKSSLLATFFAEPLGEVVRRIDQAFGGPVYSLRDVFVEERRRIVDRVTAQVVTDCSADFERMVAHNRRLLDFLAHTHMPIPQGLQVTTTFVLQRRLERAVAGFVDLTGPIEAVLPIWADARRWNVTPQTTDVRRMLDEALTRAVDDAAAQHIEAPVARAHAILDVAGDLGLTLNLWEAQNHYYVLISTTAAQRWSAAGIAELRRLGERLSFHLREWDSLATRAA